MARKERSIIVNVIENKKVYDKLLVEFFAKKYDEKYTKDDNPKS